MKDRCWRIFCGIKSGHATGSRVNWLRGSKCLKSASKLTRCSPWWMTAAASQASGTAWALSALSAHSLRSVGHSPPRLGCWTPGAASSASMKRKASAIGVGWTNTLGCVTSCRKLAMTMGCKVSIAPCAALLTACSSQPRATRWCGWSLREAATSTLASGVMPCGFQHGLVAQAIEPRRQSTLATIHRNANGLDWRVRLAHTPLQPLLNQARQASALLRRQRLGLSQQGVIQVERGFHRCS